MLLGGCASTLEKWQLFEVEWRAVLADEGLPHFHMVDFESWRSPFDFKHPDGSRDKERHNRVLNRLLDIMVARIDGFYGFLSDAIDPGDRKAHHTAMEHCSVGAISHAVKDLWARDRQPLSLVFARQRHYPETGRRYWQTYYDHDTRIAERIQQDALSVPQLQAADVFAYEALKRIRIGRPTRYPFKRIVEGARSTGAPVVIQYGPFSPFWDRVRQRGRSSGRA